MDEIILHNLSLNERISASVLASKANCTEKTVRQHIQSLNGILQQKGVIIDSKHGSGYCLKITRPEEFKKIYKNGKIDTRFLQNSSADRVDYIISYLLIHNHYVEIMDLCEILNISESTLISDMKLAKQILKGYHLSISTQRKVGVKIVGNEFDIRLCMTDYLDISKVLRDIQIDGINRDKKIMSEIVLEYFDLYHVTMPEISMENLIKQIYITVYRLLNGKQIDKKIDCQEITEYPDMMSMTKEICSRISKIFKVKISEKEEDYILLYMIGQRMNSNHKENKNIVIQTEILDLINDIFNFVYNTLGFDFRNNFSAITDFATHMVPLIIRLKYNIRVHNPLLYEIKKNYSTSYTIAMQNANYLEEKLHCRMNQDEIGYLALLFEVSMVKRKSLKSTTALKNIIIVCASGKASAELLAYQYRKKFGDYLNKIIISNVNELTQMDFKDIDYVFTTTHIYPPVPVPIIVTKLFMDDDEIEYVQSHLEQENDMWIKKYYREDLFFSNIQCRSKEEALKYMCDQIQKRVQVPDDFYDSLIKRESVGTTDFTSYVSMPHPFERVTDETFVSVGILKEPVFWGKNDISIILLLSIAKSNTNNLEKFYCLTSEFMLNHQKVKRLMKNPTYQMLIELLIEK